MKKAQGAKTPTLAAPHRMSLFVESLEFYLTRVVGALFAVRKTYGTSHPRSSTELFFFSPGHRAEKGATFPASIYVYNCSGDTGHSRAYGWMLKYWKVGKTLAKTGHEDFEATSAS